jgi:serine/threonine protein kinase
MHKKEIVHADVVCHNAISVKHNCLKIIDFEGYSIDGGAANLCYEWFSYRRSTPRISKQTDIFAYGCMVYEVITGRPPYEELKVSDHRAYLVEKRYARNQFPDVENLPLRELMHGCWYGTISSMGEVVQVLEATVYLNWKAKVGSILLRHRRTVS